MLEYSNKIETTKSIEMVAAITKLGFMVIDIKYIIEKPGCLTLIKVRKSAYSDTEVDANLFSY